MSVLCIKTRAVGFPFNPFPVLFSEREAEKIKERLAQVEAEAMEMEDEDNKNENTNNEKEVCEV